jgi:hypothetical protein
MLADHIQPTQITVKAEGLKLKQPSLAGYDQNWGTLMDLEVAGQVFGGAKKTHF